MARMQETTKQLEQQRKIKVSVILFSLTRLGCETTRFPSPDNPCPRMADHPFKWVWILEDWSENGCGKRHFLV